MPRFWQRFGQTQFCHHWLIPSYRRAVAAPGLGRFLEAPLEPLRKWLLRRMFTGYRENEALITLIRRELAPDANTVDVGAAIGSVFWELCRQARQGTHYAFEPQPGEF